MLMKSVLTCMVVVMSSNFACSIIKAGCCKYKKKKT